MGDVLKTVHKFLSQVQASPNTAAVFETAFKKFALLRFRKFLTFSAD
jgi:hypothetical protein